MWFQLTEVDWRYQPPLRVRLSWFGAQSERLRPRREAVGGKFYEHCFPIIERICKAAFSTEASQDATSVSVGNTWPKVEKMIFYDIDDVVEPPIPIKDVERLARSMTTYAILSVRRTQRPEFRAIRDAILDRCKESAVLQLLEGTALVSGSICIGLKAASSSQESRQGNFRQTESLEMWLAKPEDLYFDLDRAGLAQPMSARLANRADGGFTIGEELLQFVIQRSGSTVPLNLLTGLLSKAFGASFVTAEHAPEGVDVGDLFSASELDPLEGAIAEESYRAIRPAFLSLSAEQRRIYFLSEFQDLDKSLFELSLEEGYETVDSIGSLLEVDNETVQSWAVSILSHRKSSRSSSLTKTEVARLLDLDPNEVPGKLKGAKEKLQRNLCVK